MEPTTLAAALSLIRHVVDNVRAADAGEKTEEQIMREFQEMQTAVDAATERWRTTQPPSQ